MLGKNKSGQEEGGHQVPGFLEGVMMDINNLKNEIIRRLGGDLDLEEEEEERRKREREKDLQLLTDEGKCYVLVVDVRETERELCAKILEDAGAIVTKAVSGPDCMEKVSKDKYDLILITRDMPMMNGVQCCHNIRHSRSSKCRDAKLYVVLPHRAEETDEEYTEDGFTGVLRRPISKNAIYNTLIETVPPKMLPENRELLARITGEAKLGHELMKSGINMQYGLDKCGNDFDVFREKANAFCENHEDVRARLSGYLYSGDAMKYMTLARELRDQSRMIGATYLEDIFDDHVNMAKDDSLDVAEVTWTKLIREWERVTAGFCGWLGLKGVSLFDSKKMDVKTNGIRLSAADLHSMAMDVVDEIENGSYEEAFVMLERINSYDISDDIRIRIVQADKALDKQEYAIAIGIMMAL